MRAEEDNEGDNELKVDGWQGMGGCCVFVLVPDTQHYASHVLRQPLLFALLLLLQCTHSAAIERV